MARPALRASRNHLVMVAIILIIALAVPTPCVSSKASTNQWVRVAMHQMRRPYTLRPNIVVPNQHRTADRNKGAEITTTTTTTTTTTGGSLQHVGKEKLLNLQQQLAHERQNHPGMMLAWKALMRPTRRAIAADQLLMAASSSLAANCDVVTIATGRYRSWRAPWLQAGYMFRLHPMQLVFLCTTTTKIDKAAAKKTQSSHRVIPVVRSRRALKQLPPAPPLTIPPLPFTIPSPPGPTFPLFLPPPFTFPPIPVTFPPVLPLPLSSFTQPAVQKGSVAMP